MAMSASSSSSVSPEDDLDEKRYLPTSEYPRHQLHQPFQGLPQQEQQQQQHHQGGAGPSSDTLSTPSSKHQLHQQYAQHMNSNHTTSTHSPPPPYANHRAIKIIPEDLELSSGMHRSRSSSVQLHLPPMLSVSSPSSAGGVSPSHSRSTSPSSQAPPSSSLSASASNSNQNSTSTNQPQFNLHLLPRVQEDDEISPPLRSPSMLKPFRPNPQLVRRRGGTVYIFAIIGAAFTLFILFFVLLSGSISNSSTSPLLRTANLKRYSPSSSSASMARISSYLGTYLPFLDQYYNSAAMISLTSSAYLFGHTAEGVHTLHPILPLLQQAKQKAESITARQSTTLTQAVAQYRKRYNKDPPKGFDKWWSFAKARNHTLVDEYDSLMRDIAQFATLPAHVLKQRTRTLAQLPGVSLITIKEGKSQIHSKSGKWAPALAIQEMMNAFVGTLPDMEIAINEKAEGRVLPGKWKQVKLEEWEDEDFPLELEKEQSECFTSIFKAVYRFLSCTVQDVHCIG